MQRHRALHRLPRGREGQHGRRGALRDRSQGHRQARRHHDARHAGYHPRVQVPFAPRRSRRARAREHVRVRAGLPRRRAPALLPQGHRAGQVRDRHGHGVRRRLHVARQGPGHHTGAGICARRGVRSQAREDLAQDGHDPRQPVRPR